MKAFSPIGTLIVGTSESLLATAEVALDSFSRDPRTGKLDFDHSGNGSTLHWDTQGQIVRKGQPQFADDDGEDWDEKDLALVEDPIDEPIEVGILAKQAAATAAGWDCDEENWWWRDCRPGDKPLRKHPQIGFTTHNREDYRKGELDRPEAVYVRSAELALKYDRGEV